MRKTLSLIIMVVMLFALTGRCNENANTNNSQKENVENKM